MNRRLIRIAHGGGGVHAAPNSLEGIKIALTYGLEMIEIDVRCTRDGVPVLAHDDVLHGTALRIGGSTLAALRAQAPVATVEDALAMIDGKALLNLDVKTAAAVTPLVALLRRDGAAETCVVSCLESRWLAGIAGELPALAHVLSYPADRGGASQKRWMKPAVDAAVFAMRQTLPVRIRGMLRPVPRAGVSVYHPLVTPRLVDLVHGMGIALYTWTVDDPARMRQLVDLGVDGVTSNRLDLLAELQPRVESAATRRV